MSKDPKRTLFQDFFLSDQDDDLLASGSRDPLGFEAIWVPSAHRVIPSLNTQSLGARNFVVAWMLHWMVDRWLEDVPRTQLEKVDVETLRKDCLVVAETTYVLAIREQYDNPDGRSVSLDRLYGRGGAYRTCNEKGLGAEISPRSEHQILTGQYGNGHFGRYDAPLREFDILHETASPGDGTRVRMKRPLDDSFADKKWVRNVEDALHEWFEALLETQAPTFRLDDFPQSARRDLTRLRNYDNLAPLADTLCGPDCFEVEASPGRPAETPQGLLWQQIAEGIAGTDAVYHGAIGAAEAGSSTRTDLRQVRFLERFLAAVEAQFDLHWQSNVTEATARAAYESLEEIAREQADHLEGVETFLVDEKRTTGAYRLKRLREAVTQKPRSDFRDWLIDDYHKSMMVEERNNNAWLALDDGEVRVMNGGYAPGSPFAGGTVEPWRKRDYYLGTLKTFYEDIETARRSHDTNERAGR